MLALNICYWFLEEHFSKKYIKLWKFFSLLPAISNFLMGTFMIEAKYFIFLINFHFFPFYEAFFIKIEHFYHCFPFIEKGAGSLFLHIENFFRVTYSSSSILYLRFNFMYDLFLISFLWDFICWIGTL